MHHAASEARLIPESAGVALGVRFWDRISDFYVMTPVQALTAGRLKPAGQGSEAVADDARQMLLKRYAVLDRRPVGVMPGMARHDRGHFSESR